MKRANLFLVAAVGILVAAGCSGPSRGVEVENPTPEIGAPTAYRNMTVGVEIGYPADWTFTEISDLQVRFQPLKATPVTTDVAFVERSPEEDLADIAASLSPGVSFSAATLGDFDACLTSEPVWNGASEQLRWIYCVTGGYFMVVEHRSLPTVTLDIASQFSFHSVAPEGSDGLEPKVTDDAAGDDDADAEKVDCQADPKNPACLKKSKKICKAVKGIDSDCDGLTDKTETFSTQSDPSDPDSDDDGILDGQEMSGCVLNPSPACKG